MLRSRRKDYIKPARYNTGNFSVNSHVLFCCILCVYCARRDVSSDVLIGTLKLQLLHFAWVVSD